MLQARHELIENRLSDRAADPAGTARNAADAPPGPHPAALEGMGHLRDDFKETGRTLRSIAQGEGKIFELQHSLSENLRVLHETQQFERALHGLTAAIHLLTARPQFSAPSDSRSAAERFSLDRRVSEKASAEIRRGRWDGVDSRWQIASHTGRISVDEDTRGHRLGPQ